jgi:hypothetical protein
MIFDLQRQRDRRKKSMQSPPSSPDHPIGPLLAQIAYFRRPHFGSCLSAEETRQHVRILLAGLSNMLSDIVTAALASLPEITVVGRITGSVDLSLELRLMNADAVIAQTSQPANADRFLPLLRSFPELKIVAIDSGGAMGFVHQLRPSSLRLTELSAEVLYTALIGTTERLH